MIEPRRRGPRTAGLLLIALGMVIFMLQAITALVGGAAAATGSLVMFVLASAFLLAYFRDHNYGFLVPGGVLFGVGLAAMGESVNALGGEVGVMGLGIGFLSIFVIDRIYSGRTHFWPLIPGGILFAVGIGESGLPAVAAATLWPLLLVVAGLYFFMGGVASSRRENDPYRRFESEAEARPNLPDPYARALDDLPDPSAASDLDFGTAVGFDDDDEDEPPREMQMGAGG